MLLVVLGALSYRGFLRGASSFWRAIYNKVKVSLLTLTIMDPILCALKNEISALLALTPADNLYWCGSHTDLFEAAALVCTSFPLYTSAGHLYRVGPLIHDLCLRLHLEEPHNPRAYLFKAKHRKYIRQLPFQQRYAQCLQQMPHPLFAMVQVGEGRTACCSSSSALPAIGMHVADAHDVLDAKPREG